MSNAGKSVLDAVCVSWLSITWLPVSGYAAGIVNVQANTLFSDSNLMLKRKQLKVLSDLCLRKQIPSTNETFMYVFTEVYALIAVADRNNKNL